MSPEITRLLEFADEFSIPVICDLDDYLFDEEVIPAATTFTRCRWNRPGS